MDFRQYLPDSLLGPDRAPSRQAMLAAALRSQLDAQPVLTGAGEQTTQGGLRLQEQRQQNTAKLDSLLGSPLGAGAYGALDTAGAPPAIRDAVTGVLAAGEPVLHAAGGSSIRALANALRATTPEAPARPGPTEMQRKFVPEELGHVVYHGSPETFDRFAMEKVGTGSGAQAYGHGLYSSDNPDYADLYRARVPQPTAAAPYPARAQAQQQAMDGQRRDSVRGPLYAAVIPSVDRLLDYDRPIQEQPAPVREAISKAVRPGYDLSSTGRDLYKQIAATSGPAKASEWLRNAGIPGLTYLERNSFFSKEKPRNFVVWDDPQMRMLGRAESRQDLFRQVARAKALAGHFEPKDESLP